ncbi:hypothetical protein V8C86DRAFT_2528432 [Haematococcus lacustris]
MQPAGLRHFIFRSQVLSLFRKFAREIRHVPPASRSELAAEVRRGFEEQRGVTDLYAIKYHLSEGRASLKRLQDMLGLAAKPDPQAPKSN